ncbi:hypothetical protein [Chryseobacterium turcicum]|uniref:Sugar-binding protein n=1 Tax=Chryseobacterium turcicum TaxID=2898076 RepID=A0A9Q3UXY1_9FLAO|nr:hypothetical protein [Chryseobacterium turcicum]MCD1115923.1 hypothetical protein [Chryseobacterium turcicum]
MKNKLLYILLASFNIFSYAHAQQNLENTPAKYFNPYLPMENMEKESFINEKKIKKITYIKKLDINNYRIDTIKVSSFDREGREIRTLHYSDGKKSKEIDYLYQKNEKKSHTKKLFMSGKIYDDDYGDEYYQFDENKNVIYLRTSYKKEKPREFKYLYKNSKLISREHLYLDKINVSFEYIYNDKNLLTEYTYFSFENEKAEKKPIDQTLYFYDIHNNCIKIIVKLNNETIETKDFKYNTDKKLIQEIYNYSNYGTTEKGQIDYIYKDDKLSKITEKNDKNGKIESEIFYIKNDKLLKIVSNYSNSRSFRFINTMSNTGNHIFDYQYDNNGSLEKLTISENGNIKNVYEFSIEYY